MAVQLEYALLDNQGEPVNIHQVHSISNFRQRFFCPACHGLLTVRLGKVKVHHFAHRPEQRDYCAFADGGESVFHYNVKCYVAQMLRSHRRFAIRYLKCHGCGTEESQRYILREEVNVGLEVRIGPYLADVGLSDANGPYCAVEIYHQHRTEDEKIQYFEQNSIRYLELYAASMVKWTPDQPLTSEHIHATNIRRVDHYQCDTCAEKKRKEMEIQRGRAKARQQQIEQHYQQLIDGKTHRVLAGIRHTCGHPLGLRLRDFSELIVDTGKSQTRLPINDNTQGVIIVSWQRTINKPPEQWSLENDIIEIKKSGWEGADLKCCPRCNTQWAQKAIF